MKTLKLMIAAAVVLFAAVGCSKDATEDALTMGTTEISEPAAGSSLPLNFTANTSWTVSSDQDWVSFDRMSGDAGEVTVTMTVEANPDYEDRTATVTIKAGTKTTLFKVVQRMLETFSAEFVYEVGPEEQIIEFALESNKEYVFSIDKDCAWISFAPSQSSAPESSVMKFRISELTELKPREGRIVAKVDDVAYALIVKQKGAYDYMTSATATYYGRTMRMYDDENGYYHYDEYVVELTNEEGVTVHLAVNAEEVADGQYLAGIPVGTYTVDASGMHTPGTFAGKPLDGSESVYTAIVDNGVETVVVDGEISIEKEGSVYTVMASLVDGQDNVNRYSFEGEIPSIEDKGLGAQLQSLSYVGHYDTVFTTDAKKWNISLSVTRALSDEATAFPASWLSFTFFDDATVAEVPTGTFTFNAEAGATDPNVQYPNGNKLFNVGDMVSGSINDEADQFEDRRYCNVEAGSMTISRNDDGTYKFVFDLDLIYEIKDDKSEVIDTEKFTYNGTLESVKISVDDIVNDEIVPELDGDIVIKSSMNMGGMYYGNTEVFNALNPAPSFTFPDNNSLLAHSVMMVNGKHTLNFTLCAPGWVYEKNFSNRFCNTMPADGTYNYSLVPANQSVVPYTTYSLFTNGYTGTKFMIVGGTVTVSDASTFTFDLKISPLVPQGDVNVVDTSTQYSLTGSVIKGAMFYYQDKSASAGKVKFWAGPSGN